MFSENFTNVKKNSGFTSLIVIIIKNGMKGDEQWT
jgi:hypothetical protein